VDRRSCCTLFEFRWRAEQELSGREQMCPLLSVDDLLGSFSFRLAAFPISAGVTDKPSFVA
jgi:hypothetical protein